MQQPFFNWHWGTLVRLLGLSLDWLCCFLQQLNTGWLKVKPCVFMLTWFWFSVNIFTLPNILHRSLSWKAQITHESTYYLTLMLTHFKAVINDSLLDLPNKVWKFNAVHSKFVTRADLSLQYLLLRIYTVKHLTYFCLLSTTKSSLVHNGLLSEISIQ